MYLFVFVDFFKVILLRKKNLIAVKELIETGKFFTETFSSVMAFHSILFSFFFNLLFLPVFFILYGAVKCDLAHQFVIGH